MPEPQATVTTIPDALPVLPLDDAVLYPGMVTAVVVGQAPSLELVSDAMRANKLVAIVTRKIPGDAPAGPDDLYRAGTVALVHELGRADDAVRVAAMGIARIRTIDFVQRRPYLVARVEVASELEEEGVELDALLGTIKTLFSTFVELSAELSGDLAAAATKLTDPHQLAYLVASTVPLRVQIRQEILELDAPSARLRRLVHALQHEISVRQIMHRIATETAEEMSKAQREHILRKHMEAIQRELGESAGPSDTASLRERLSSLPLNEEARTEATRELERLERTPEFSPEHGMIRTYLDWVLKLPWGKTEGARIDIAHARAVLDEDHYDLDKVKNRIIDYLAVKHLREARTEERALPSNAAPSEAAPHAVRTEPILCFVGPPGVGKTSLGQSIARALGRSFVHQSLGGVHDEAEIRGHRRTYIGAMPGRILQALARAGAADPVFMLDEIDKLGTGFHGDPSAALLELLDPAQNHAFADTYLGVPFDLSRVLFICTANTTDSIPPPLLDRMEMIELPGYTERDKLHIARRFLIPGQREANGLREGEVELPDETILATIRGYTREAGVRNLEREVGTLLRKSARRIAESAPTPIRIDPGDLRALLGPRRVFDEVSERIDRPGVAAGLAWTPAGGQVLFVEASMLPGDEDRVTLTGMLGNVMRESAEAALTYLRANAEAIGVDPRALRERRAVHVHVPAGAIPKDGPSAGITMLVALASHALGRAVHDDLAMTGEITLRGKVLPVGGIKEKVLAAHRVGLGTILLPRRNEGDLEDVPEEIRRACRFVLVDSVEQVLDEALGVEPEPEPEPEQAAVPVH